MTTTLQTDIQSRAVDPDCFWEHPRVYARIFNSTGRKTSGVLYKFLGNSAGPMMCQVDNQDHVDFLLASGNFYVATP
jgi:hypothetical protein